MLPWSIPSPPINGFSLGPLTIRFYALCLIAGMFVAWWLGGRRWRARGGTALFFDDPQPGRAFFGSYGASKAAQIALVRSWQAESARLGPGVAIATPPPMPTALRGRFFPGEDRAPLTPPREVAAAMLERLLG